MFFSTNLADILVSLVTRYLEKITIIIGRYRKSICGRREIANEWNYAASYTLTSIPVMDMNFVA
jgi:hypothetical protein